MQKICIPRRKRERRPAPMTCDMSALNTRASAQGREGWYQMTCMTFSDTSPRTGTDNAMSTRQIHIDRRLVARSCSAARCQNSWLYGRAGGAARCALSGCCCALGSRGAEALYGESSGLGGYAGFSSSPDLLSNCLVSATRVEDDASGRSYSYDGGGPEGGGRVGAFVAIGEEVKKRDTSGK